jgi:hypothetical protein
MQRSPTMDGAFDKHNRMQQFRVRHQMPEGGQTVSRGGNRSRKCEDSETVPMAEEANACFVLPLREAAAHVFSVQTQCLCSTAL